MAVDSELRIIFKGVDQGASSLAKGIGGSFNTMGGILKKAALAGGAAIAGLGAGAVVAGSKLINLGSDAQETGSLIQTSLGDAAEGFNQQLRDFASEANRSFYELQEGSSTIVAMTKAMGAGEQGAADFGVQFGMMASDLGSFFNRTDEEVFLDLQSALGGSSETLQKYGVDIRETTLKQMALNQGLIESASEILPPLTRATLIQQAIQEQATDAMGDAIRTSDSWSNSMRGLKGRLRDTFTELGTKLIPIMTPLLNLVGDLAERAVPFLTDAFDKLLPILQLGSEFIGNLIAGLESGMTPLEAFNFAWGTLGRHMGLLPEQIANVRASIQGGIEKIIEIKNAVIEFLQPIMQWIGSNVQLSDVLTGLAIVIGGVLLTSIISIVTAMAPIILTIGAIIAAVALLRQAWENDFLSIRTTIMTWAEEHGGIMQGIKDWWADLQVTWEQLKFIIQVGVEAIVAAWNNFKNTISSLVGQIKEIWGGLQAKFESVKNGIMGALQPIINLINEVKGALSSMKLPDWMTPGSPTPWEIGLKGVRNELQALYRQDLPALNTSIQGLQSVTNNRSQVVNQTNNIYTTAVDTRRETAAGLRFAMGGI